MVDTHDGTPGVGAVSEAMLPLEPYTAGELASRFDASKATVRRFLNALARDGRIRKKVSEPERVIWIRDSPKDECPRCGNEFEIKHVHPVLQAVPYCPTCGSRLRRHER